MKTAIVRSSWIEAYGYRLDCSPYLGGALEAKILLETLPLRKDKLHTLTAGFDGGIYNGPKFSRTWVESPDYGVPFVGSGAMLYADLSGLPLLSKILAYGPHLRHLELRPGMSLISCSGTIGNMVYARADMAGVWSSQHIMKVVADPARIPSGYLYAYLSSRFGVPLVVSGTYGSIIQSIGPEHIADLPVPRLSEAHELEIHTLVERAAELRTNAIRCKLEAVRAFVKLCGLTELTPTAQYRTPLLGSATSATLAERMDSTYYIAPCTEARADFDNVSRKWLSKSLGALAEIFVPTIFKRLYADDPKEGYPYITGTDVFCIRPKSEEYLMNKVALENRLVLHRGMIVLHEAGQRYGLIGRSVMVGRSLDGFACTNNMVRLIPHDAEESGYIFAVLSSEHGLRLLKREAAGSSIPHLDERRVAAIEIPWPAKEIRVTVAALADEARDNWDRADELEDEADTKVVGALTKAVK
jgi:type I restriction enzyme S subunit